MKNKNKYRKLSKNIEIQTFTNNFGFSLYIILSI